MQPKAQTTTRGSLAVSAGALEIANVIQGALEVFWFTFTFSSLVDRALTHEEPGAAFRRQAGATAGDLLWRLVDQASWQESNIDDQTTQPHRLRRTAMDPD